MAQPLVEMIDRALAHHSAGRLKEAEGIYRQILAQDPSYPPALHLLGVATSQMGNKPAAAELIRRAIAINPGAPEFHANLALVYIEDGRADLGLPCAQRAVQLKADYPDALNHLGNALRMLGRTEDAINALNAALRLVPNHNDALNNLALTLMEAGRTDEAASALAKVTAGNKDNPTTRMHLARLLHRQKRYAEAKVEYEKVIAADHLPSKALSNLGAIHQELGNVDEAIKCYLRAIEIDPKDAGALNNYGYALSTLDRLDEAIELYHKALAIRPDSTDAYNNLANAHRDRLELEAAEECYHKALYYRADHVDAHWNRSILWLLKGDFARGWHEYEWRWVRFPEERRGFPVPQWDGSDVTGKSILLHAEQGLGDTLQFVRYAPLVAERGATVYLECQPVLAPLLRQVPGVSRVIPKGEPLPAFDVHCPMLSLPYAMRTTLETIPSGAAYLQPDPGLSRLWAGKIGNVSGKKIGISWAGSPIHGRDRQRSLALEQIAPLFDVPGVTFFSLQKQRPARDDAVIGKFKMTDFTADFRDFADSAALVANLDLVICVDTASVHLAGALGKPVWMLCPHNPDWRWLLDREDSPWYPTVRLFRQPGPAQWPAVIERVARELTAFAGV